jgi:hypothetical protein
MADRKRDRGATANLATTPDGGLFMEETERLSDEQTS